MPGDRPRPRQLTGRVLLARRGGWVVSEDRGALLVSDQVRGVFARAGVAGGELSIPFVEMVEDPMIAYGPVPSRRLGRSLGINNIPPKICTYSCAYCQLGRTTHMQVEPRPFYEPQDVLRDVQDKVERVKKAGEAIDYLSFVPDGEPTLDANLGREIELLQPMGIRIAIITNSSLISRDDVRNVVGQADWVSLKVDAASEDIWRQIDRPHRRLQLRAIQEGMLAFAKDYEGVLATETMLVKGVNDGEDALDEVAAFLARLKPDRAYVAVPIRPPAEPWARGPDEGAVNRAYQVISERVDHVEYLIGYEGNAFASTGDVEEDLLSITAVHPMREDAIREFLARADADWAVVRRLMVEDQLVEAEHAGHRFYLRRLPRGDV